MSDKQLSDVHAFQTKFGHGYEGGPRAAAPELLRFRLKFLAEELKELGKALGFDVDISVNARAVPDVDLIDALDALVDLDYVLKGTALQLGFGAVYQAAWDRVHAANMTKIAGIKPDRDFSLHGFDVTKPPGWTAPDLSDLVYNKSAAE